MQVDPIKPKLNAPGTKHLKLKCDELLSNFAFKFSLRRYIMRQYLAALEAGLTLVNYSAQRKRFLWDRGCIYG